MSMRLPVAETVVSVLRKPVVPVAFAEAEAGERVCGSFDKYRLAEECTDYTWLHLPNCDRNPLPSREVANAESFAARIAFSSFPIRSWLR